jgi:hypothetical protein
MGVKLTDIAAIIRSKNAGPYELTLDIVFKNHEWYSKMKTAGFIEPSLISRLYGIKEKDVLDIIWFDPAAAVKITIKRPLVSGDIGETDVYGAQQHAPLLGLEFELR